MSEENEVPKSEVSSHFDTAQSVVTDIRALRERIPNLAVPAAGDFRKLTSAATLPEAFVEQAAASVANSPALVRGGGPEPALLRDLLAFAEAFAPVAVEIEALAHFVRHTVATARHTAGTEALTTYALAQRLAKRRQNADLAPHVEAMRKALGRRAAARKQQPTTDTPSPAPTK